MDLGALFGENLPLIEWVAVGLGLGYVVLAARSSLWCWPLAFVSSLLWAWQVFFAYQLYFDTALNIFYAVMAIVGYARWTKVGEDVVIPITKMTRREHLTVIVPGLLITVALSLLATQFTEAARPFWDALTTVFSIFATFLVVNRKLENWLYLCVMDAIYVVLYFERGSILFAGLFVLYTILALWGYADWKKQLQRAK